ncbi:M23 family metallopeptidase [Desulfocurvus sp. DL9XJH121]
MSKGLVLFILVCLFPCLQGPAGAQELTFETPIQCDTRRDCFLQQYFDHDPGPGYRDYACGALSYDGHKGTDFRLRDLRHMERGVPVLAAADGEVRAVRDGMDDVSVRATGGKGLEGRFAGNSVVLVHAGGVETQYSHLQKGSVRVRPGDRVRTGQVLGLVGLSGRTEFPHLEFAVRVDGRPVDPFRGLTGGPDCGPGDKPMWSPAALAALPYEPTRLLGAGMAERPPTKDELARGGFGAGTLAPDADALVFWVRIAGLRAGDEMDLEILGPDGGVQTRRTLTLDRSKAQVFRYVGLKRRGPAWPEGEYTGRFVLRRSGDPGGACTATAVCRISGVK